MNRKNKKLMTMEEIEEGFRKADIQFDIGMSVICGFWIFCILLTVLYEVLK